MKNRISDLLALAAELAGCALVFTIAAVIEADNKIKKRAVEDRDQAYIDRGIKELEFLLIDEAKRE